MAFIGYESDARINAQLEEDRRRLDACIEIKGHMGGALTYMEHHGGGTFFLEGSPGAIKILGRIPGQHLSLEAGYAWVLGYCHGHKVGFFRGTKNVKAKLKLLIEG